MRRESRKSIQSVKKFYFLEYFYVLLKSIEKYSDREQIFESFKTLKQEYRLGESKYKILTADPGQLSKVQRDRYRYTFEQVIDETKEYELISEDESGNLFLKEQGREILIQYKDERILSFNESLLKLMEAHYGAFRHLIELLYRTNKHKQGLLIFPNYSPLQLGFERSAIKTTADFNKYSKALVSKLEQDMKRFLGETRDLRVPNIKLMNRLTESGLLPVRETEEYDPQKYNAITKRFRDYWIIYFLRVIYKYEYHMSSFDLWMYRGKQIGIVHITEFYPGFNGRIVYPTAAILRSTDSKDFDRLYEYSDGMGLFVHKPTGVDNQNKFIDYLVKGYYALRRSNRSYFTNLASLREIVCYNMRISSLQFENFLNTIYKLNLADNLPIRISLEVDRLPEETKAIYLKQEPVMVDGKYRNIIAIDVTKEITHK